MTKNYIGINICISVFVHCHFIEKAWMEKRQDYKQGYHRGLQSGVDNRE
jgi:hypothetical protein